MYCIIPLNNKIIILFIVIFNDNYLFQAKIMSFLSVIITSKYAPTSNSGKRAPGVTNQILERETNATLTTPLAPPLSVKYNFQSSISFKQKSHQLQRNN